MKTIRIACTVKDYLPLDDLVPFQGNLKSLSKENYDKLRKEIEETGFASPVHVWRSPDGDNKLINGHQRTSCLKQMQSEGYKIPEIPVVFIDAKDAKEAKRRVLQEISAYGKVERDGLYEFSIEAEFDPEFLEKHFDLPNTSLDWDDWQKEFFDEPTQLPPGDEDAIPEPPKEPITKRGDIWILGEHRLMCGDATSIDDVEKLMNGNKAEICFTSPPYADQREYNGDKELSTEYLATFIRSAFRHCKYFAVNLGYSRKGGEVNPYWDDYIKEAKACDLKFLSWNIWDKMHCGSIGNQTAMFGVRHEWVFVFGPAPKDLNRTVPNKNAGYFHDHAYIRNADGTTSKGFEGKINSHRNMDTVLQQTPQMARNLGFDHPAMFPVEFPESYIEAMTNKNDGVYEPFAGSGTTLIACEKTGRHCFAMELDPRYVDTIVKRFEEYSGKKAVLETKP